MVRSCAVNKCYEAVSPFHSFPKNNSVLFKKWLIFCANPHLLSKTEQEICSNFFICDAHFEEKFKTSGRRLKKGAVPSKQSELPEIFAKLKHIREEKPVKARKPEGSKKCEIERIKGDRTLEVLPIEHIELPLPLDLPASEIEIAPVKMDIPGTICGLCSNVITGKGRSNMMTTVINKQSSIHVFNVIESISKFKYSINGPQYLCSSCFNNVLVIYDFQEMCNRVQENMETVLPQTQATILDESLLMLHSEPSPTAGIFDEIDEHLTTSGIPVKKEKNLPRKIPKTKSTLSFIHSSAPSIVCKLCRESFPEKLIYDRHLRIVHEEHFNKRWKGRKRKIEKTELVAPTAVLHSCPYCDKSFKVKESLSMHLVVHSGQTEFVHIVDGNDDKEDLICFNELISFKSLT